LFIFEAPIDPWRWVRSVIAVFGIAVALLAAILLGRMLTSQPLMPQLPPATITMPATPTGQP
jgi:hypothetical protein